MANKIRIVIPVKGSGVGLTIFTTNETLLNAVCLNWGANDILCETELEMHIASDDGSDFNVKRMEGHSWLCRGVENYSALKIAIRGVLSDAGIENTIFVHGCSFELHTKGIKRGIVLVGASGAGKTTLVSSLINREDMDFYIVNDDWGAMSLSEKLLISTQEKLFHMKLNSIMSLNPQFKKEALLMEEKYRDGFRGFADPAEVYPHRIQTATAEMWVILIRDTKDQHFFKCINCDEAADIMMKGSYSAFYCQNERFMNGALILDSEDTIRLHHKLLCDALQNMKIVLINNTGSPKDLHHDFIQALNQIYE